MSSPHLENGKPKLIWLLFVHRHGDRSPIGMGPKDKYHDLKYWPEGYGNLNNAGRRRMYKLGKFIRRRYDHYLGDNFRQVYSRSSDVERCIESSNAVLAGMYPPGEQFQWDKDLPWIPAAVHTVEPSNDYLLNESGRKYIHDIIQEIKTIQQSEAVKKLYAESVNERELLEKELGYVYDTFYKFKCSYSSLDIEYRNGLQMPDWYTEDVRLKLYRYAGVAFALAGGGTEKLKRIRCGHLFEDILKRMNLASVKGPTVRKDTLQTSVNPEEIYERKVVHYSTHDSIMASILESLNVNLDPPIPPAFGSTFFFELYVDVDELGAPISEKYIKLYYLDDTESEAPIEKHLPNCKLDDKGRLTLNNFKEYVKHLLPAEDK